MFEQQNKHLIFVIYDGIENSVFQSQVLAPLVNDMREQPGLSVTLISFEQEKVSSERRDALVPLRNKFNFIALTKVVFVGKSSLWFAGYQLKNLLAGAHFDEIIARGPLAGWVARYALRTLTKKNHPPLVVQARGLCAQEYRYTHQGAQEHFFKRWLRRIIYNRLEAVEREIFESDESSCHSKWITHRFKQAYDKAPIVIEAVSPALKKYLIDHFNAKEGCIAIAVRDLPQAVCSERIVAWRAHTRQELKIAPDVPVYCYSGSYKPWQCAGESIEYFFEQYKKDPKSFMLVLSHDAPQFIYELETKGVPKTHYVVMGVAASELCRYLAAADFGLILREPDIINWVSRPTKLLEYQAVGLRIVHNNTIAWLNEEFKA